MIMYDILEMQPHIHHFWIIVTEPADSNIGTDTNDLNRDNWDYKIWTKLNRIKVYTQCVIVL